VILVAFIIFYEAAYASYKIQHGAAQTNVQLMLDFNIGVALLSSS